jgi:hypothetical protein
MLLEEKSDGRLKSGTMSGEADPTPHRCTLAISSGEYDK